MSIIRLTDRCNLKCLFCNFQEKIGDLSLEQIKSELDNLRKQSEVVIFSGGEPTLNRNLLDAIKYAKELGFKVIEIQTNSLLLADVDFVYQLKSAGLTSTFVPFHSYQPEIFDYLTNVKGSFAKTIKALNNLIAAGIKVRINIVINQKNYGDLLKLTKFIIKNFPQITGIDYSFIVSEGEALTNSYLIPRISNVIPFLLMAFGYCQKNKMDFCNPGCGIPVCFIPEYKNISLEYELLQQSKDQNQEFINKNKTNKIKLGKCLQCADANFCLGIWKNYLTNWGTNEFDIKI